MKPESLVELIGSGNTSKVEEVWMALIESDEVSPEQLAKYDAVLRELSAAGQQPLAATMAWAAIETASGRSEPIDTLRIAGPFLLAVGEGDDLRAQVVALYRAAYTECDGLEALLAEAGLGGGRPVRRALRTLEVCLSIDEGSYLVARGEDGAARVVSVDRGEWEISVSGNEGKETLGAVHLADRYRPADPEEFRVMRHFAPEALAERVAKDPVAVVTDLCRRHGGKIDSDKLEEIFVPAILTSGDWKKWWTKARTALRRSPNIEIEGRTPVYLTYVDAPAALEEGLYEKTVRLFDPMAQLKLVDGYLRECSIRGQEVNQDLVSRFLRNFEDRATKAQAKRGGDVGLWWAIALHVAEVVEPPDEVAGATEYFRAAKDVGEAVAPIKDDSLLKLACNRVISARPDDWTDQLLALLPMLPAGLCDHFAGRLIEGGRTASDFEPAFELILASPVAHFEALLWLWDGPSNATNLPMPASVTILSRVVHGLDDARRDDNLRKAVVKKITGRARSVLSARRYERFNACLDTLDAEMAGAIWTRIHRLDNLGRVVREDLLSRLRKRFPLTKSEPELPKWRREDVIYTTAEGMAKKQAEIEHHVNVKMKENAIAIGRAAERGDLSENSEYKFALEERDLLRARLAQMNSEMEIAEVLDPADVPTDHAGVGTRVLFRSVNDGSDYQVSFVGPWEADAEKQWINYRAPLAEKVLGKRIGDRVTFDHSGAAGEYEIVSLENALDHGQG